MCRLTVLTATNIPSPFRHMLMDWIMMHSSVDNEHGWGITDGLIARKGKEPYSVHNLDSWSEQLDADQIWVGHVRNASAGTDLTDLASHPFILYRDGGIKFIAAHNGAFTNTDRTTYGAPRSDSWEAFNMLADAMERQGEQEPSFSTIQEWINDVGNYAAFAFVLHFDKKVMFARNDSRFLYAIPLGNGLLINTSDAVLRKAVRWIKMAGHADLLIGKTEPYSIPAGVLYTVTPGDSDIVDVEVLTLPPSQYSNYNVRNADDYYWERQAESVLTTTKNVNAPATNGTTAGATIERIRQLVDSATGGALVPNAGTPKNSANVTNNVDIITVRGSDFHKSVAKWEKIRRMTTPMREALVELWMQNFVSQNGIELLDSTWYNAPVGCIESFHDYLVTRSEGTSFALHATERKIIDAWNKKVPRYKEVDTYTSEFGGAGTVFFIHMPHVNQAIQELTV